jgi:hypothetical protein
VPVIYSVYINQQSSSFPQLIQPTSITDDGGWGPESRPPPPGPALAPNESSRPKPGSRERQPCRQQCKNQPLHNRSNPTSAASFVRFAQAVPRFSALKDYKRD